MTTSHDAPNASTDALSPRAARALAQARRLAMLSSIVAIGSAIAALVAAFVIAMRIGGVLSALGMIAFVGPWAAHRAIAAGCLLAALRPLGRGAPGAARARLARSIEWLDRHVGERLLVALVLPDVARVAFVVAVTALVGHALGRLVE